MPCDQRWMDEHPQIQCFTTTLFATDMLRLCCELTLPEDDSERGEPGAETTDPRPTPSDSGGAAMSCEEETDAPGAACARASTALRT